MQADKVDLCLVGTDRTTATGDVCNKIGTYLKALAARESHVPFYACVPGPSIDWAARSAADIPIEERDGDELRVVRSGDGTDGVVRLLPADTRVANPGFDVTPGGLLTGLITERGVCPASRRGWALYPERVPPRVDPPKALLQDVARGRPSAAPRHSPWRGGGQLPSAIRLKSLNQARNA
jgi:methylthioribose-1-phosphate isomerase